MEIVGEAHVLAEKSDLGSGTLERLLELNFGSLVYSDSTRMTQGVYMPAEGRMILVLNNRNFLII
jgi:hypothetical protein